MAAPAACVVAAGHRSVIDRPQIANDEVLLFAEGMASGQLAEIIEMEGQLD